MKLLLTCKCGKRLQTSRENAGKTLTCPGCGKRMRIPGNTAASPAAAPAASPKQPAPAAQKSVAVAAPRRQPAPSVAPTVTTRTAPTAAPSESKGRSIWLWLLLGGVGMVVLGVIAGAAVFLLTRETDATDVAQAATVATLPQESPDPDLIVDDADEADPTSVDDADVSDESESTDEPAVSDETSDDQPLGDALAVVDPAESIPDDAADPDGSADDAATADDAPPPLAIPDPTGLAIKGAASSLLDMTDNKSQFGWGFVFPLISHVKVVDYEEYQARYRVVVDYVPVYQHRYANEEKVVAVKDGYSTRLTRVVRRKVVASVQVGTQPRKRVVGDPNGPIIRYHKKPIYGPGGSNTEPATWPGNNGMALYALRKAGVPAEDKRVARLAESLDRYIGIYGVPELTWDVAWCLMAFSEMPGEAYEMTVESLVARLVSGQVTSGASADMWGPLCVNPDTLVAMFAEYSWVEGQIQRGEAFVKAQPKNNIAKQQLARAKNVLEQLFTQMPNVSRFANRLASVNAAMSVKDELGSFGPVLSVAGPPYNIYREVVTDLESTALAVQALRVAHERGKLPSTVELMVRNRINKPLLPPIEVSPALVRTLKKIAGAQDEDGKWDEMIAWHSVPKFEEVPELLGGKKLAISDKIESKKTPIATAHGTAALQDLTAILGDTLNEDTSEETEEEASDETSDEADEKITETQISAAIDKGRGHVGNFLRYALEPNPEVDKFWSPYYQMYPRSGGCIEMFSMLYHLRIDAVEFKDEKDLTAYAEALSLVFGTHQVDGLWKTPSGTLPFTPGLRERAKSLATFFLSEMKEEDRPRYRGTNFIGRCYGSGTWKHAVADTNRLATVYAMMFLTSQAVEPLDFTDQEEEGDDFDEFAEEFGEEFAEEDDTNGDDE